MHRTPSPDSRTTEMKKQMEKLQVRINQNLNRTEKSVALPHELERIEETVLVYKQVCSTVHKKLCEYLPSAGDALVPSLLTRGVKWLGENLVLLNGFIL